MKPLHSAMNDTECAICLGMVNSIRKSGAVTLECSHIYHNICLRQWFSRADTCPLCKHVPLHWPFADLPRPAPPGEDSEDEADEDESDVSSGDEFEAAESSEHESSEDEEADATDTEFHNDMQDSVTHQIVTFARQLENDEQVSRIERNLESGIPIGDYNAIKLFRALSTNTRLQYLVLQNQNLTNASIRILATVLARNRGIRVLNLSYNEFDADGITHLSRALMRNKRLTHLVLDGSYIGDDGVQSIAQALMSNKTLEHISLKSTGLTTSSLSYFSQAIARNKTLTFLNVSSNSRISSTACISLKSKMENPVRLPSRLVF